MSCTRAAARARSRRCAPVKERSPASATPAATTSLSHIAQIALTVNGGCCPRALSTTARFPFVQRTFELQGGPAAGVSGVEQLPDLAAVFARAHAWLDEVEDALAAQLATLTDG